MVQWATGLRKMLAGINVNILANGAGIADDDSHWTGTGANPSIANGGLTITDTGSGNGYATKTVTTVVGKIYKVTAQAEGLSAATGNLFVGAAANPVATLGAAFSDAAFATKKLAFIATSTTTTIGLTCVTTSGAVVFKNITCSLASNGFQDIMDGCLKATFQGQRPTNPDADFAALISAGTIKLLATLYSDIATTAAMHFDDAVLDSDATSPTYNQIVSPQAAAETWAATASAAGTAQFELMYLVGDSLAASTTAPRIMASVATSGADGSITGSAIVIGQPITETAFKMAMPGA